MSKLRVEINVENEQIVLGALLNDREAFRRVVPDIRPEEFNDRDHREIFRVLQELWKRGVGYAADTVVQLSGEVVSLKYLRDVEDGYPALEPENLNEHLAILHRDAVKHSAVKPLGELYDLLDDPHSPVERAESAAFSILSKLRSGCETGSRGGEELFREWYQDLEDLRSKRIENFRPLYFSGLDEHLYEGLRPGMLVVVAARPAMGKSTFCSNVTLRQAMHGRKVLSVPVEAGTSSVIEQMACALSKVEARKLVREPDKLDDMEMKRLKTAAQRILLTDRIVFNDRVWNMDELELLVEAEHYDVWILDLFEYLLRGDLDAAYVTQELRRLKKLAKRRGAAVIVVQQIRRIKRMKNNRPFLHELKNSGGYEEVADLVLLLHRDKYYDPDADADDVLEINIAKQRRGPQNITVGFEFLPEICRIGKSTGDFAGGGRNG